jgi:LytS/YehU family sensor histidine kinase
MQNGNEIAAPVIYDRPKRNQDAMVQMIYYFLLSWLLLTVMTLRIKTRNRYILRCITVLLITVACYFIAPSVNWMTGKSAMIFQLSNRELINWMVILKCTVALVVAVLYGRIYQLLYQQQEVLLENEHLRTENIQSRYNMLVGQINPHFFFNSLNSLSMLVRDGNEQKALEYIDQLSYTFRYIIQNGQSAMTPLKTEMEFASAYGELFKVRYADKLFFDIEIDPKYNDWLLPALSLQPLIGNAVKHNTITKKQPFHISIYTEDSTLVVKNNKSPKLEPEPSTGIGLKNLHSRWQLISGTDIEIIDTDKEFIVRLPLQRPDHNI